MDALVRFLFDFLTIFFNGIKTIALGIFNGFREMFNIPDYIKVIRDYDGEISGGMVVVQVISIVLFVLLLIVIFALIIWLIKRLFVFRKRVLEQEEVLNEVGKLQEQVVKLQKEKDNIMAMKVSQLGLNPGEELVEATDPEVLEEVIDASDTRFTKLTAIDIKYKNFKPINYNNTFSLPELVDSFRNFAASKLGLYYSEQMIIIFLSAIASTKLVILQGISGTGKTSLAYAWGKFVKNDSCIASVQPSWRDRTEFFGYLNEFTKKFNETEVLAEIYKASYTDDVYTMVLDEMNIARVEYYFAEMLSILELPTREEWLLEIVPAPASGDPVKLENGKLRIPGNMWYIGTINNDDSTFMVTDKVYDRAMPIYINDKGKPFDYKEVDAMNINASYLEGLFAKAKEEHPLTAEMYSKIEELDDYVIQHFRIAFGNRIVKHMRDFVPVFVACGGTEVDAVDYFIARKILTSEITPNTTVKVECKDNELAI